MTSLLFLLISSALLLYEHFFHIQEIIINKLPGINQQKIMSELHTTKFTLLRDNMGHLYDLFHTISSVKSLQIIRIQGHKLYISFSTYKPIMRLYNKHNPILLSSDYNFYYW